MGTWLTPGIMFLPTCVIVPISVIVVKPFERIMEICQIILTPHVGPVGSFNVIGTDTDRSATLYDFLLLFHSNCAPISYRFRDKGQYLHTQPPPYI